jgi:hypothetical protein
LLQVFCRSKSRLPALARFLRVLKPPERTEEAIMQIEATLLVLTILALTGALWMMRSRTRTVRRLQAAANAHAEREIERLNAALASAAGRQVVRGRPWVQLLKVPIRYSDE